MGPKVVLSQWCGPAMVAILLAGERGLGLMLLDDVVPGPIPEDAGAKWR